MNLFTFIQLVLIAWLIKLPHFKSLIDGCFKLFNLLWFKHVDKWSLDHFLHFKSVIGCPFALYLFIYFLHVESSITFPLWKNPWLLPRHTSLTSVTICRYDLSKSFTMCLLLLTIFLGSPKPIRNLLYSTYKSKLIISIHIEF